MAAIDLLDAALDPKRVDPLLRSLDCLFTLDTTSDTGGFDDMGWPAGKKRDTQG